MKKRNRLWSPKKLIDPVRRSLENRVVFCADCDGNRVLTVTSSGNLICSSCGSKNWMHRAAPIILYFKEHDEQMAKECLAVDRYINSLEKEIFFSPSSAPI
jgi:hypothetical protein